MAFPCAPQAEHGRAATGKSMTAATPRFTPLQGQYLAFIRAYSVINRRPPSEADMQRFFGVTAPSVHQMVVTLEARGVIARVPGKARAIRVLAAVEDLPPLVER
ncbi:MAG: LexA family protein [Candidatus Dormibacteraceae bacterium]